MTPSTGPFRGHICKCERPLLTEETCLRCGRPPSLLPEPAGQAPQRRMTWSRAHIARAFQAFAFFRGRAPVAADWSRRVDDWPPLEAVEALFGTVEAAVQASGLEGSPAHVR
jgi:hypothetical protein